MRPASQNWRNRQSFFGTGYCAYFKRVATTSQLTYTPKNSGSPKKALFRESLQAKQPRSSSVQTREV